MAADVLAADRIRMLKGGYLFQSGGVLTDVNGRSANIISPDAAFADNGVIHVIDRVVLPAMKEGKTLLDVATQINQETGEFSILIAAVQAADPRIAKLLAGKHQITVFAPTDAAFQSLLQELGVSADQLLKDKKLLTRVLLYHVAPKRLPAAAVLASDSIRMAKGGSLLQSGGVLTDANGRTATIISPDAAFADNGVIHVIDRVVLPRLK